MGANLYLKRYAYPKTWIDEEPSDNLGLTIVIPAFKEPEITKSLNSLKNCSLPLCDVEILIVINEPENAVDSIVNQNNACLKDCLAWIKINETDRVKYHVIWANQLPIKDHGVGLARKIGMDEAIRRFESIGNVEGIIACYDADSTCSHDYLLKVVEHFKKFPQCPGASIYFEHPINDLENQSVRSGIIRYELHLRYYIHAQRFAGFPYAFQTIGSSMAVRAEAYQKQGGMNKRKAGEDFYFLHKIIGMGGFKEIRDTSIYPSSRESDRVPFGTGRAISDWLGTNPGRLATYNPRSFIEMKSLFLNLEKIYKSNEPFDFSDSLSGFLKKEEFQKNLTDIRAKTKTFESFEKRFYTWFNAFKVMKYLHYSRDHFHPNIPVEVAAKWLLNEYYHIDGKEDAAVLLDLYRKIDKGLLVKVSK